MSVNALQLHYHFGAEEPEAEHTKSLSKLEKFETAIQTGPAFLAHCSPYFDPHWLSDTRQKRIGRPRLLPAQHSLRFTRKAAKTLCGVSLTIAPPAKLLPLTPSASL
jgi:hypothetical protein